MGKRFREKMRSDYMRRQIDLVSSVGLFYLIIVALFAVPLLATFVVVMIKGILDFRYFILGGGAIVSGLAIYFAGRFCYRFFKRLKKDGASAIRLAKDRAKRGEAVQLDLLGGLFSLSCGGNGDGDVIEYRENEPLLLEGSRGDRIDPPDDPVQKLRALSDLRDRGIVNADEFGRLKEKIISDACDS